MTDRLKDRIAIVTGSDSALAKRRPKHLLRKGSMIPEVREQQVQSIPWKRAAEPREIAALAIYLSSEEADYVSGQTFTIDGGLMMNMGQGA